MARNLVILPFDGCKSYCMPVMVQVCEVMLTAVDTIRRTILGDILVNSGEEACEIAWEDLIITVNSCVPYGSAITFSSVFSIR